MRTLMVLLVATMTAGCGAKFASDDDGGAGDSGTTGDGATNGDGGGDGGGWSPVCPAALPAIGSACATDGVTCEYGTSVYTSCNSIVMCAHNAWTTTTFPEGNCPSGPLPGACPSTFASVQRGAVCTAQGTECAYPEGACRCETQFFGPPQPSDGGLPAPTWHCDDPGQGCPTPRPRIGSACSVSSNLACTYRECSFAEQCMGGYWVGEAEACANAGGSGDTP